MKATLEITQSPIIANAVKIFSTLALVTSFLGVALGLLECIEDLLKQSFDIHAGRISLGLMTFIPPVLFSLFYPEGFILALGYAGQMFAFYAVVLPVALVWKARSIHPNLPYQVWGGKALLIENEQGFFDLINSKIVFPQKQTIRCFYENKKREYYCQFYDNDSSVSGQNLSTVICYTKESYSNYILYLVVFSLENKNFLHENHALHNVSLHG